MDQEIKLFCRKVTPEIEKEVIDFYKSRPMTYKEVEKECRLSRPTISKILIRNNIKQWTRAQLFSPELKENYFEVIDSPTKAYFLGLIQADGNIFIKQGKQANVNISLKKEDWYLLEKWLKEINSNRKITSDGRGCGQAVCYSNKMAEDLKKLGIYPRKTGKEKLNKDIPLWSHYLRGFFDGDGSAGFYSRPDRKVHEKRLDFCSGSESFLIELKEYLEQLLQLESRRKVYNSHRGTWQFDISKNSDVEKLICFMYQDAEIFMIRKKNICDKILEEIRQYRGNLKK